MVGFGKRLRDDRIPEWRPYYINYKLMKGKLKAYVRKMQQQSSITNGKLDGAGGAATVVVLSEAEKEELRRQFMWMLDMQIEKIVLFILEQQGQLASRLAALSGEREAARASGDPARVAAAVDAYRAVGSRLLDLLHFVEMNAVGIRKILKKFDKRYSRGGSRSRLTDYYVATRSNHPYSQLQQVFRHVGIGAMVGTLTRSLAELKSNQTGTSLYDDELPGPLGGAIEDDEEAVDPVIRSIQVAQERLTDSTSFLKFVAKQVLLDGAPEFLEEERAPSEDEYVARQYHLMSLLLNLGNTFLYMVNTYIVVPTADKYSESLGAASTLCGVVIGSMAVAQLVSSVYFSAWSNTSYYHPLLLSSAVLFVGNLLYALALDLNSLPILLLGRVFCGLGSARAVNRRYISDWVPLRTRLKASAGFVSASALGMAVGPALAAVFEVDLQFLGLTFNANTLPGWFMAAAWLLYTIWLLVAFKEPQRMPPSASISNNSSKSASNSARSSLYSSIAAKLPDSADITSSAVSSSASSLFLPRQQHQPLRRAELDDTLGLARPLLADDPSSPPRRPDHSNVAQLYGSGGTPPPPLDADALDDYDDNLSIDESLTSTNDSIASDKPASSIREAYSLLTTPVKVQLFIYFMLKYAMEIVLSESSVVTSYYFDWSTRAVAGFLGLLGLTVLPVNYLVGSYISNIFEDRQLLFVSELITCAGLAISFAGPIPYTAVQYVTGSLITFVAAEVLEGVNLSLLSKVMSSRLSRGTYNNGLLSTEAGMLARVVADATITLAGYLGTRYLLNVTLAPTLLIGLLSLAFTSYTYNSLF